MSSLLARRASGQFILRGVQGVGIIRGVEMVKKVRNWTSIVSLVASAVFGVASVVEPELAVAVGQTVGTVATTLELCY